MAILHRFGSADEFDPNKMQVRELAYVNTTNAIYKAGLYLCYAPGDVRRQTTEQDIINILNTSTEAYTALQQLLSDLELNPSELTNILSNISVLQTSKLDKVGDSKDNITTFTEFATDTDIVSGEKHSTFLSKILKSIKTLRSGKIDKTSIGQTDIINDANKVASTTITYAHGQSITAINNNLVHIGTGLKCIVFYGVSGISVAIPTTSIPLFNASDRTITITNVSVGDTYYPSYAANFAVMKYKDSFFAFTQDPTVTNLIASKWGYLEYTVS